MREDITELSEVNKPQGEIALVYFSSPTENTKRYIEKFNYKNFRIPFDLEKEIVVNQDFVLVCPTYSGGGEFTSGAVPKQVIQFLNNKENRNHCKGVIATGNTNFGNTYCLAGPIISQKLQVPLLYQLELSGTSHDIKTSKEILENFWK